jgi:hypothetical protein
MAWIDEGSRYTWDQEYRSYAYAASKARELTRQYKMFVNAAQREDGSFMCFTHNDIGDEPHSVACRCARCWLEYTLKRNGCSSWSIQQQTILKGERMKQNDVITTRHVSFRWDGKLLILTTQQSQMYVTADKVVELLQYLYSYCDEIIAEAHDLPEWARDPSSSDMPTEPYRIPRLMATDEEETGN